MVITRVVYFNFLLLSQYLPDTDITSIQLNSAYILYIPEVAKLA